MKLSTEENFKMVNDLDLESCSIERPESTKASGTETCEMDVAWNDTQTVTDMKENS